MVFYSIRELLCAEGDEKTILPQGWRNATFAELPHVTECAQHVDFAWLPTVFLLLFCPIVLYDLHKINNYPIANFSPIVCRIVICIILIADLTISLLYNFATYFFQTKQDPILLQYMYGDILQYIGLALALVLLIACRNRGIVTSGVLFIYWLLMTVCGLPEFRFLLSGVLSESNERETDLVRFILYFAFYVLVCIQLLLSCMADTPSTKSHEARESPELHSSFLRQITFEWFTPLARKGHKKPLERSDLWNLNERDSGAKLNEEFEQRFLPEMNRFQIEASKYFKLNPGQQLPEKMHPSVLIPIFGTYRFSFLAGGFFKLVHDLLQFAAPILLRQLLTFIQDKNQSIWIGIAISLLMFLVALVQSMILHQYFHIMFRLGMNMRSVLTSAVYKKALNLSNNAKKNKSVGEIVNIMSVDIQRMQDMTSFIMLVWSAPLQVILSIYFLYNVLGFAVFAGLAILIALLPFNMFIAGKMKNCQIQQMKFKDERLKMMSELLNGIKVLKLYAWEKSMEKLVQNIREREITVLKHLAYLNATTTLSWSCAPFLVAVLSFGIYVLTDPKNHILTPEVTFVAIALFNILRFPLAIFSMIYNQAMQTWASNKRLCEFFSCEEMDPYAVKNKHNPENAISIEEGEFAWEPVVEMEPVLKDINIDIKRGSLVAIVGRVGSGKSSLLQAILGEMNRRGGPVNVSGSVAYVAQQAWIQNQSLKENILFNRKFDSDFYRTVVEACALAPDLEILPNGDETEIGEKGINLSGGQKQRVSLARAVYSKSEIILLDDPLSAVDSHVGRHIFEQVISSKTGILKNTTRVLVTHGLHNLKYCDHILVLKEGQISESGTYKELLAQQGEFSELIEEFLVEEAKTRGRSVSFGEDQEDVTEILKEIAPERRQRIESQLSQEQHNEETETVVQNGTVVPAKTEVGKEEEKMALLGDSATKKDGKGKLVEKENVETGKVAFSVYMTYIVAIGVPHATMFIAAYIFSSVLGVCSNLWLAKWSDDAEKIQHDDGSSETQARLWIYAGLGMGQAVSVCFASVIMALGMVKAGRILHDGMLSNILRSPMSFFDTTPLGRILNRFGKDVDAVDVVIPNSLRMMINTIFAVFATMFVIIYATPGVAAPILVVIVIYGLITDVEGVDNTIPRSFMSFVRTLVASCEITLVIVWATPLFTVVFVVLFVGYCAILRFYVSTSRQLKRLESASRSPIFSHFQESIQGASSIRAYNAIDLFVNESQRRVDENLATYYPSLVANRWLAVRLELVGNCIVLFAALFAVGGRDSPHLTAGLVGLSVAYALNITQTLNWAVRMTSELETNIVAVERIKEYSETPTEGNKEKTRAVEIDWPGKGEVSIKNFSLKYREGLDLVLRDISVHISPMEKIGIVGRTGAGKSSLTLALFRIVEADGGFIEIDGENISRLSLEDLRSRLTIVPQDPVLFSGSLRMNLDPFDKFNDEQIWTALSNAHLAEFVGSLPDKLMHQISEGGNNMSVGQRQLICLARALLRKTKILILDEAAAAVDVETDALLQKTIREQFKDCTVLTIAHRLNTVMDSDRILVLDRGTVAEFDAPKTLLANSDGVFHSMARDAGIV